MISRSDLTLQKSTSETKIILIKIRHILLYIPSLYRLTEVMQVAYSNVVLHLGREETIIHPLIRDCFRLK